MRLLLLFSLALVCACTKPAAPPADNETPAIVSADDARTKADRQPIPTAATRPPSPARMTPDQLAPAQTISAKLAVDGEGLRLVDGDTGQTTPLAFGMPGEQLLAILEKTRGSAVRGTNTECGAGPLDYANWADGLSIVSQRGRFVGWSLGGRARRTIATMAGIGPGSSRQELSDVYLAQFSKTTLGTEFQAGAMGGLLDGPTPSAKITDMWAGVTCLFR